MSGRRKRSSAVTEDDKVARVLTFRSEEAPPQGVAPAVWAEYLDQSDRDEARALLDMQATERAIQRGVGITLLSRDKLDEVPAWSYLVDGVLVAHDLNLVYGQTGSFKSFVALDLGLHVSSGSAWHGRAVQRGDVVYIAGEGASGIRQRVEAWEAAHPDADTSRFFLVPHAVNLYTNRPNYADVLTHLLGAEGVKPALVVVDTQARCAVGASESDPGHMNVLVAHLVDHITRPTGAAVLVLHHADKENRAERGTESVRNASATVWRCMALPGAVRLTLEKIKDAAKEAIEEVRLETVEVADSLVLRVGEDPALLEGRRKVEKAFKDSDTAELSKNALTNALGGRRADALRLVERLATGAGAVLAQGANGRYRLAGRPHLKVAVEAGGTHARR